MPAAFARSASRAPERVARSALATERSSASFHCTAASVRPLASSMSCAERPRLERNTAMRGRSGVPTTFARTRRRRRRRRSPLVMTVMLGPPGGSCALTDLTGDVLALVADALALVGLRRALLADDGGHLADGLLGDPPHDDARRLGHLELDAIRCGNRHRVRVADRQLEVLALELRAVADALDLETLLVARGHALDHVGNERAGESVQGTMLAAIGGPGDDDLVAILGHCDVARDALGKLALRALHADRLGLDRHGDAGGHGDGLSTDPGHGYQTWARTSPPTPAL